MSTYIKTLKQGSDTILPRTKTNAISNQSGDNLDAILTNKADLVNGKVPSNQLPPMDYAPAGFGLGDSSVRVTGDWNDVKTNGWYRDESGTAERHSPFVGAFAIVLVLDYLKNGDTMQIAYSRSSGTAPKVYTKQRTYNADSGVWGEWEWANHHVSGILKGDGTGGVSAAVAGTDYLSSLPGRLGIDSASFTDANQCVQNGWYADITGSATNVPANWGTLFVSNLSQGSALRQDYFVVSSIPGHSTNYVRYWHYLSGWSPWESVNPAKIETGSYVGTGTFGGNNPNSITFSFKPKVLIITSSNTANTPSAQLTTFLFYNNDTNSVLFDLSDVGSSFSEFKNYGASLYMRYVNNTFYWYTTSTYPNYAPPYQYNKLNTKYHYLAIG